MNFTNLKYITEQVIKPIPDNTARIYLPADTHTIAETPRNNIPITVKSNGIKNLFLPIDK